MSNPRKEVKVGDQFGELTVVELAEEQILPSGNKINIWKCKCGACGGYDNISQGSLLKKKRTKCHNCTNPNALQDLTGQTFGYLKVLRRGEDHIPTPKDDSTVTKSGKKKKRKIYTTWICECQRDGNIKEIRGDALRSGKTISCGCVQKEKVSTQGGLSHKSVLYKRHRDMLARCGHTKGASEGHKRRYEERGIEVKDEWLDKKTGFLSFYKWALDNGFDEEKEKEKPKNKKLTIDRINNNGNYQPENCRWATAAEQAVNKENTIFLTIDGETHPLIEWWRIYDCKIPLGTVYDRYHSGMDPKDIFEIPPKSYVKKIEIDGKMCTIEQCSYVSGINKFAIYDRLSRGWSDYDAVFKPTIGRNKCINGVYFVDDNGYPVAPPTVIEEKNFVPGVEFITDANELEQHKAELNARIEEYKRSNPNLFS